MSELTTDIARLLVSVAAGGWGSAVALAVFGVMSLVIYVKVRSLYKKLIVDENNERQQDAIAKNPVDNATDSASQRDAEQAVEDELKKGGA